MILGQNNYSPKKPDSMAFYQAYYSPTPPAAPYKGESTVAGSAMGGIGGAGSLGSLHHQPPTHHHHHSHVLNHSNSHSLLSNGNSHQQQQHENFLPVNDPSVLIARQKGMYDEQNKLPPIMAWNDYRSPYKPSPTSQYQHHAGSKIPLQQQDSSMSRFYYNGNSGGSGSGGSGGLGRGGMIQPSDNSNGRISSNTSYSLLPNKYSLIGTSSGSGSLGMRGGRGVGSGNDMVGMGGNNNIMQMNGTDPMMSPHHVPSTYDYSHYGSSLEGIDGYGSGGALNSSDLYNEPSSALRASSRIGKIGPMQPGHNLRQKYFDSSVSSLPRGGALQGHYSDEDEEEDIGIVHHGGSESSAVSSEDEEDIHASAMKQQEALMKAERRASQASLRSSSQTGNNHKKNSKKNGKSGKAGKNSKRNQKDGKSSSTGGSTNASLTATNTSEEQPDKVEQIVSRLQQEYQVFRVDRVELDQTGPSPEELAAAAKKKRGELDSAGSNSRDSGVSIGAGSVASAVHTPAGDSQPQQQASLTSQVSPEDENSPLNHNETISNGSGKTNSGGSGGKKEGSNKRKSSLKTGKKSGPTKVVQHAIGMEDGLSRDWKSTPDVASIMDDYDPRMTNYRKLSTTDHNGGHDIMGNGASPYHSSSALASAAGENNNYMTLHRKPVLAGGRRQSLGMNKPPAVDLGELEDRQLALIQQESGRASRLDYQHQLHPQQYNNNNHSNKNTNHLHSSHSHLHNGYGGGGSGGYHQPVPGGFQNHLIHQQLEVDPYNPHQQQHHPRQASSMLDIDKAPSRESSAGSGNTYSLHDTTNLHPHYSVSTSSHNNLRTSKSTGNLLGVGVDDPYRQPIRGGGAGGGAYFDVMEQPPTLGRRLIHSRLANHPGLLDLGNSTDDMEFPMTPQSESSSNTLPKQSRGMITGRMNSKVVPKKIYKGSFREVNARGKNNGVLGTMNTELFPADLKPVSSPKHALPAALLQVQASDWETNVDGFRQLVRLARHHPEFIRSDLHNVNMNALRHVMNLRSQVCRAAILFFRELFMNVGKAMEHDSERIAEKLLDKAADTNKFIREDSGKALEALVLGVSPAKALSCLDLYGTRHRNPAVRSMTARMTTKLIDKLGPDRSLSEVPERLLPMLCKFLQEGSLDTRMSAKLAFSVLMESPSFDTQLKRHVPADTLRHVQKAMKAITTKS